MKNGKMEDQAENKAPNRFVIIAKSPVYISYPLDLTPSRAAVSIGRYGEKCSEVGRCVDRFVPCWL
jgi:hypothetical protein